MSNEGLKNPCRQLVKKKIEINMVANKMLREIQSLKIENNVSILGVG
jgi:hypothetical protein